MRAHCGRFYFIPVEYLDVVQLTTPDVTLNSGLRRLNLHLPEEAEEIKKGRWRMVGYVLTFLDD